MNHILQPNRIAAGQLLRIPHLVPKLHGHHYALNSQTNTDRSKTLSTDHLNAGGTKLGDLSMRYETGYSPGQENLAAARVSSGIGDRGGVSYGAYQLNSKSGDKVRDFLRTEGAPWQPQFAGLDETVSGGPFEKKWKEIATATPQSFFNAQHAYIRRTNYGQTIARVETDTGINLDMFSIAVRNVVWSVSVQHGGAFIILERALHDLNRQDLRNLAFMAQPARKISANPFVTYSAEEKFDAFIFEMAYKSFERDLIMAIYRERKSYLHTDTKMSARSITDNENRYVKELPDALAELDTR